MSGVPFPEAVQIWSGCGCDWKGLINSMVLDPLAGKALRSTDSIPLRSEQLRIYGNELVDAAQMEKDGILEWEFVVIDAQMLVPLPVGEVAQGEKSLVRCAQFLGKKSRQVLPAILCLMRQLEPKGSWDCDTFSSTAFRCAGTSVHIGMPPLAMGDLGSYPSLWQIALIPHISSRGLNGAWIIRRRPNHPDVTALADTRAFYIGQPGDPDLVCHADHLRDIVVLELFSISELAIREASI